MGYNIGALVVAKDEEDNIEDCLSCLDFAEQIVVVVDSRTKDRTAELALQYTRNVYIREFLDFSQQKNFGLGRLKTEWVLVCDCDERITEMLRKEITDNILTKYSGFWIPRQNHILGKPVIHGGLFPDYQLKVFRRNGAFYQNNVHELPILDGEIGYLTQSLMHYNTQSFIDRLRKAKEYAKLRAIDISASGTTLYGRQRTYACFNEMYERLMPKRGFLDGWRGVYVALSAAMELYLSHKYSEKALSK